jgi:hypothetical protein
MAKIGTYSIDGAIAGGDKLIGTDISDGSTKNFTVSDLTDYIGEQVPAKTLMEVTAAGNTSTGDVIVQGEISADSALIDGTVVAASVQSNGAISGSSLSSVNSVTGATATFTGLMSTTGGLRFTGDLNIGGGNNAFTFTSSVVEQDAVEFNGRTEIKTELINMINLPSFIDSNTAAANGLVVGDIYYNTAIQALSIVLP